MAANFTLPTSTNARNVVATPLDRATTNINVQTPQVKTSLEVELPKDAATLRIENSKFMDELSQLNRPIDRMQNLTSSCSQRLQRSVNNMNPINYYAQDMSNRIQSNIQQSIRISTNIAGSSVIQQIDQKLSTANTYANEVLNIPSTLNRVADNVVSTAKNAVMSTANSAINFVSSAINLVGSIINFVMSMIGGCSASAFQMERTCRAKMDTRPPEIVEVAQKTLNGMMSIKPPTQTEWSLKKVDEKLRSFVGLVSKFDGNTGCSGGSGLSGLALLGSQCTGMLNTCMGMARQVDALYGQGTCLASTAYMNLCTLTSLGDIGNISDYLKNTFPNLSSPISVSITLPKINSTGFTGTIERGEGLVNLGNNQQATSTNIVDPTVAAGGTGNITGTGSNISDNSQTTEPNKIPQATVNNGTVTNATILPGKIELNSNSSISDGTLTSPNGDILNKTVWGNISSGNISESLSGAVLGDSDKSASIPSNTPTLKDLYGGEITGGKIENATISIIGLEDNPINFTNCTITISGDTTIIIDENYNQIKITPTEISYNNVITPSSPNISIILVSGNIAEIYVTNIFISNANNGDCGSRVIEGTETQEVSSNPIQHTVQQMVQTNRQGIVLETVMNGDDSKKSADSAKDEIVNAALEETLNPELDDLVNTLVEDGDTSLYHIKDVLENMKRDIEEQYRDTLATLETKDPDPFANSIKKVLNQIDELYQLIDTIQNDIHDLKENLVTDRNKTITNNMNILLDTIDQVKDEIDNNVDDQLKDIDIIFKALDREAQLIDQIQPNTSDKTKDDSCTIEYRTYI